MLSSNMIKEIIKYLALVLIIGLVGWRVRVLLNHKNTETASPSSGSSFEPTQESPSKQLHWSTPPSMQIDPNKTYEAIVKTTKGEMAIDLFAKDTPITVNNFVFLARQGFYDHTKFHRIIKDFMIQGGDPIGTGRGGPGYTFKDELPITKDYKRGIVAMANAGPNTNGSQFFIMTKDTPLSKNYVIFGKVVSGFDTLDKIAETPVKNNGAGEISQPTENVYIESIKIIEK